MINLGTDSNVVNIVNDTQFDLKSGLFSLDTIYFPPKLIEHCENKREPKMFMVIFFKKHHLKCVAVTEKRQQFVLIGFVIISVNCINVDVHVNVCECVASTK